MFQTEPNIFLQSFRNDFLTFFMRFITTLGYEPFFVMVCVFVLFSINFRKGFILTNIIIWIVIVNIFLKNLFALPRPLHVDTNVLRFYGNYPEFGFVSKGAKSFFGFFDEEVINYIRNYAKNHDFSFGFPSGHVMCTTGLWVSLSLFFQKKLIIIFTPIIIILMAISRMYLGRHFLADVTGSAIFGLIVIFILYYIYIIFKLNEKLFDKELYIFKLKPKNLVLFSYLIILPLILLFFQAKIAGSLLAVNLSFYIISIKGLPDDHGTIINRVFRVSISIILYFLIYIILKSLIKLSNINDDLLIIEFIRSFIPIFSATVLTYLICLKTKLYKLENDK